MDRTSALIVAGLLSLGLTLTLWQRDATMSGDITPEREPLAYWGIVAVVTAAIALMLTIAWNG